jgi:homoprotocatechuate degradation regulator HpaR
MNVEPGMTERATIKIIQDAFLPRNTRRSLPIALLRAREAVMSHFRPMLGAHDITEQQWRVIRILAEQETVDASELADKAFILAPSLTRIIRSLEERGIIAKLKDENDGRRVLLKITPAGMAIINEVAPESRMIYDRLESRFGREKLDLLLDLLDEVSTFNEKP